VNRNDFQKLSRIRVVEAKALLDVGQYSGAYYLCGYAVECAIKACIAKQTGKHDFPDKQRVIDSWSHDFNKLVTAAGLQASLELEIQGDAEFGPNWKTVKSWSEQSRYDVFPQSKAEDLYKAVTDKKHGVLKWLSRHW
jgi:hypothetical protein